MSVFHVSNANPLQNAAKSGAGQEKPCTHCIAAMQYKAFHFLEVMIKHTYRNGDLLLPKPLDVGRQHSSSQLSIEFIKPDGSSPVGLFICQPYKINAYSAAFRIAVELKAERGPWMKVQAGAVFFQSTRASSSSIRAKLKVFAIFDER